MKIGITYRLFLAILAATGLAVISSVLIMQWSLNRGFLKFINAMEKSGISRLAAKLEENYLTERNWEFLQRDTERWRHLIAISLPETAPPPGENIPHGPPPGVIMPHGPPPEHFAGDRPRPMPPHIVRHFDQRLFLLDADKKVLIGHLEVPVDNATTPLRYQGNIVGYLGLLPRTDISDAPQQQRFLQEQKMAFTLVAGVLVLLSAVLSLLLARRLVRPLSELARATHQLAAGSFNVRVPVASDDELGRLAGDFNSLAVTLEKSEQNRRQWVADISHELRTPIAILRGEIEALQDGIRQPNQETVHSLHAEVLRLGRLVDDLYQLSLSDVGALTYQKDMLDIAELLTDTIEGQQKAVVNSRISVKIDLPPTGNAMIFGDPERLHQLFSNLLENSLKYTDSGGKLQISMKNEGGNVAIDFKDSSPGVPEEAITHLFERLYRVESSRNRATGGAGLGLAICRNIVEAHGGSITAQQSPLGGVWIRIELPKAGR